MFASKNELFTRPSGGYNISRSVRLRSSASAYLNRTLTTPTNATTFTFSAWIKRGKLSSGQTIIGASVAQFDGLYFNASDQLVWYVNGVATITTTAVFRDPSAWYHVVLKTSGTTSVLYVNNTQVGTGSVAAIIFNTAISHIIGQNSSSNYFDGYLTEINFIDGQALTPSSFGETDAVTGVWKPKKYAGTYGTNGFYLNFSDNSAATAAAIGKDSSGNGNNWTPNNISVTSGSTYDSMTDVPTLNSATAANYAVQSPLYSGSSTITNGNLQSTSSTTTVYSSASSMQVDSGKWYWEVTVTTINSGNQYPFIGAYRGIPSSLTGAVRPGGDVNGFSYRQNGVALVDSTTFSSSWGSMANGDVIGVALDLTTLQVSFYKTNTLQGTITGLVAGTYTPADSEYNGSVVAYNFGQRPFAYTPPTGFKALNTFNLPDSTINNGAKYMAASTWTGDSSSSRAITNGGNNPAGVTFQPDFVWIKNRSAAYTSSNALYDSVRGAGSAYLLLSNSTGAEGTQSGNLYGYLSAFNSNGFTAAKGTTDAGYLNQSPDTYVGWQWKAGGTAVSNTSGSITSTVSVNATAGFSVVTWTGTGAAATVGHGLGVAPKMIILKPRSAVDNWPVWHGSFAVNEYAYLNLTNAKTSLSTFMNGTLPSSTVISLGTWANTNTNATTMVAYCWSEVAGFSKFGSYTGNGSTDGPFVYCGFRPKWLLLKNTGGVASWYCLDSSRNTYNVVDAVLVPNTPAAEVSITSVDFLSNGFKLRTTTTDINGSGTTYIFAAFAENPTKYALAR